MSSQNVSRQIESNAITSAMDFKANGIKTDLILESTSGSGTILGTASTKLGFYGHAVASKPAALTAAKVAAASLTIADAEGTPDYALQAVTNSSAYGFASAAEAISTLYVIQNLVKRVEELEAKLQAVGLLA